MSRRPACVRGVTEEMHDHKHGQGTLKLDCPLRIPPGCLRREPKYIVVVGVDPHKSTHTTSAVHPATNADLGSVRIEATLAGYKRLIAWAKPWPQRRWAVENADGLSRHLSRWLIARGDTVVDVPTTATARVLRSRAAVAARTTRSTPLAQRVSPRCKVTANRSSPTNTPTHCGCWMNGATICPPTGLAPSTSCTRCFESCWPTVLRPV